MRWTLLKIQVRWTLLQIVQRHTQFAQSVSHALVSYFPSQRAWPACIDRMRRLICGACRNMLSAAEQAQLRCSMHRWPLPLATLISVSSPVLMPAVAAGVQLHSHNYRLPATFANQTVLVVGASNSGEDVSRELAPVAKHTLVRGAALYHYCAPVLVFHCCLLPLPPFPLNLQSCPHMWSRRLRLASGHICHQHGSFKYAIGISNAPQVCARAWPAGTAVATGLTTEAPLPQNAITRVPMVTRLLSDGTAVFEDGSSLRVDAVVYCTGYRYRFPFLEGAGVVTASREVSGCAVSVDCRYVD